MHVASYYWKDLSWELWKVLLPDTIIVNWKPIKLLDYHVPSGSAYVVLESYFGTDLNSRIIHVLNFGGIKSLTVGRCRESNIRILDNSVSRMHSLFTHIEGKYYLSDLSSKFGSQRIFRRPIKVKEDITIQIGKTLATFMLTYPEEEWWWKSSNGSSRNRVNPFTYYEMVHTHEFKINIFTKIITFYLGCWFNACWTSLFLQPCWIFKIPKEIWNRKRDHISIN